MTNTKVGKLFITRGLPGSGKTTWARETRDMQEGWTIAVSRDDYRDHMFGQDHGRLGYEAEKLITHLETEQVRTALKNGYQVLEHSMNLRSSYVRAWRDLAQECGAEFQIVDFTDVPLDTCLQRDFDREVSVGSKVIMELHTKFVHKKPYPLPVPEPKVKHKWEPYVRPEGVWHRTVIVDLDGTVAHNDGTRGWYEYDKVATDKYHEDIADLVVYAALAAHCKIRFVSGRSEDCRRETEAWLADYFGTFPWELYMRGSGDHRDDAIVKYELFDANLRDEDVWFVLDDRDRVVKMWRELGLRCLQVAEGNF